MLIVEDNLRHLYALSKMVERQGWVAICAESAEEALSSIGLTCNGLDFGHDKLPDIITIDVELAPPGMDGLELTHVLRAHEGTAGIPIVLITVKGNAPVVQDVANRLAVGLVIKVPLDEDIIIHAIKSQLNL